MDPSLGTDFPDTLFVRQVFDLDEGFSVWLVSDAAEIEVFSHQAVVVAGQRVPNRLVGQVDDSQRRFPIDWPDSLRPADGPEHLHKTGPYSYRACGTVFDYEAGIVEVLGFRLMLGELPCTRGAIEFTCWRVELPTDGEISA